MNAIVNLESILEHLNVAILYISPAYKSAGKDPLERGSYRGVSVTPVISKLLETLILSRLEPTRARYSTLGIRLVLMQHCRAYV